MSTDKMMIEILEDGTIKLTSDPISAPNHANAEQFFQTVARLAGGENVREKRSDKHSHHHHHGHSHSHEHDGEHEHQH